MNSIIVAIAGGTGSGKSYLTRNDYNNDLYNKGFSDGVASIEDKLVKLLNNL